MPHVLVATPGRLLDLVDDGFLTLGKVTCVVLDEADKMLSLGFKPQLDRLLNILVLKPTKGMCIQESLKVKFIHHFHIFSLE